MSYFLKTEYNHTVLKTKTGQIVIDHEFGWVEGYGEFKSLSQNELYGKITEYSSLPGNTALEEDKPEDFRFGCYFLVLVVILVISGLIGFFLAP